MISQIDTGEQGSLMCAIHIRQTMDAEVIVVGGGPAGASAAAILAEAGFSVILLDRMMFPRDKVCGDFVGPVALLELEKLGVTTLGEYRRTNVIREATLYLDGQSLINHPIPEVSGIPAHGRVIRREVLDNLIYQQAVDAGVDTREHTRVTEFTMCDGHVQVGIDSPEGKGKLTSRLLIGADGSGSIVARGVRGGKTSRHDRIIAVRAYFEPIAGPHDRAELYFTSDTFPGYYWLFPTGDGGANVGVGILIETFPPTSQHPRDLLMVLVEKDQALRSRLGAAKLQGKVKGWPLVTYNPDTPMIADGVMLVGDAAGLINPLNGEGIQYALLSARWAAETAAACLRRGDISHKALEPYARRVKNELRYDMALASMIVQLTRNRRLNSVWLHALRIITSRANADPDYAAITGGVLAGIVPASAVLSPSVILHTARQAAITETITVLRHAARGPEHWATAGISALSNAADMLWEHVRHPVESARWGGGVVLSAAELVSQMGTSIMRNVGQGVQAELDPHPRPTPTAPTVRVQSCTERFPQ